ncbi:hypothetical protein M9458_056960, partial [Cirrhinus mrigala]
ARVSLEKRLHDIAEDLQPEPTMTMTQDSQTDEHLESVCTDDVGGLTETQNVSEPDSESESEVADEPVSL